VHPIPRVAAAQFGVFSAAQALHAGWTASALRHAGQSGYLDRVRRGVYAEPLVPSGNRFTDELTTARRQAAAASVVNRRVPVSHGSGAALLGLALIDAPRQVCLTFPRGRRDEISGAHRHRGRLFPGQVIKIGRILLLSPARTVVDLGCELGVDAAIVAADSVLRNGLTSQEGLSAALQLCSGWPGVAASARAIHLANPRAESVLESLSRLRIVDAGLPPPEPQVTILDHAGHFCGRVDFYWDEFGVVGEADGMGKYDEGADSLTEEKKRQGWVEDTGLIVVRWGWADLDPFDAAAARLRNAFARGLRPDRAPRRWQTWTPERPWPRGIVAS
jgi:hypothetical protein